MKAKKTFICYIDWIDYFDEDTTMEQKGQIFDAILRYQNGEENVKPEDPAARMVFNKIKKTMRADADRYEDVCNERRKAANARWEKMQKDANACKCMQKDYDTDTDTDTETETDTELDLTHMIDDIDADIAYWDRVLSEETA